MVVVVVLLLVVVVVACPSIDIAGPRVSEPGKGCSAAVVPSASCDGNEELRIMLVIVRASG